jgi:hypothetical protein
MSKDYSDELREAMDRIRAVCRKYNCGAVVTLHDGEGMNEFAMMFDVPTWSKLEMRPGQVRVKIEGKSNPEDAAKTINMLFCADELLGIMKNNTQAIMGVVNQHFKIESDGAKMIPRTGYYE